MVWLLIVAAAAGAVATLLVLRLWVVLHSQAVTPRKSLSVVVVAGSGKYRGADGLAWVAYYKPQKTPRQTSVVSSVLPRAVHAGFCSFCE